jgi:hypothetical protein
MKSQLWNIADSIYFYFSKVWIQICGAFVVLSLICSFIGIVLITIGFTQKKDQETRLKYYRSSTFVYFIGGLHLLSTVYCKNFLLEGFVFEVSFMITALILFPSMFMQEIRDRDKDVWYFGWVCLLLFPLRSHLKLTAFVYGIEKAYGVAWGATIFLFGGSMVLICDRNKEEIYYREKRYLNEDDDEKIGDMKI